MKTKENKPPSSHRPIHETDAAMRLLKYQMESGSLADKIAKKTNAALKLKGELNSLIEDVNLLVHDTKNPVGPSGHIGAYRVSFDLSAAIEANHHALAASRS